MTGIGGQSRTSDEASDHHMQVEFKRPIKEQIRQKLICFEGEAKKLKARSAMKWWSKCISMIICNTAIRNVAFKASRMSESVLQSQDNMESE